MNRSYLLSTSGLALIIGAGAVAVSLGIATPAAAWHPEIEQNTSWPTPTPPIHTTILHDVDGIYGNNSGTSPWDTLDDGTLRLNEIYGGYANGSAGVGVDQQNNGSNNAIGEATSVVVNAGTSSDVTQDLYLDQSSTLGKYRDIVDTSDDLAFRKNVITDAYKTVKGILVTQQNNGDGNAMATGNAVAANFDTAGTLGDVVQRVKVDGEVIDNSTRDQDSSDVSDGTYSGERWNTVDDSAYDGFKGIASFQKNNGNANVMGTATSVVANIGTNASSSGEEDVDDQSVLVSGLSTGGLSASAGRSDVANPFTRENLNRSNLIDDVFNDGSDPVAGIVNGQQNNGDQNVLGQGTAVVANINAKDDIDDVGGSRFSSDPGSVVHTDGESSYNNPISAHHGDLDQNRGNEITYSFQGFLGIANLQQNNGNHNVMLQANGVTANINTHSSNGAADDAKAAAAGFAVVEENDAEIGGNVDRTNVIHHSFNSDAGGIVNIQQNNGHNNVISSANSVVVSVSDSNTNGDFLGDIVANAGLEATVSNNTYFSANVAATPGLTNDLHTAFQGFDGIRVVQQNNGANNAIQSAIAVVANLNTANISAINLGGFADTSGE